MLRGRGYQLKLGTQTVDGDGRAAQVQARLNTLARVAGATLALGEIGVCNLAARSRLAFDPYGVNRDIGGFILVDRLSGETVGAGMLHFALRRAQNVHWQALDVNKSARAELKGQRPCVLWYTGLSGAGKSTIANLVDKKLHSTRPPHVPAGRRQRPPRAEQGSRLHRRRSRREHPPRRRGGQADGRRGLIVSTRVHLAVPRRAADGARADRARASSSRSSSTRRWPWPSSAIQRGCTRRRARGELKNFTGIDSPYEAPENPELKIDTTAFDPGGGGRD